MDGKLLRVLTGVHTAGKTTIGHHVEQRGFIFFPEIAVEAIAGAQPWSLPARFDDTVISRELERDAELRLQSQVFFVETDLPPRN
jgi:predicted ATPase